MSTQINNKSFKIIISILCVLLLCSLFYIYKMSDHSRGVIVALRSEKADLEYDLNKTKLALDSAIAKKGHLNTELISERAKIEQLLKQLKSGSIDDENINQIKLNSKNLELRIAYLMHEIEVYKKQIDSTKTELYNSKTELYNSKTELTASKTELNITKHAKDTLENRNIKLTKKLNDNGEKLAKASKLTFYNLEGKSFKRKSSGELASEDRASKINMIKASFIIGENELATPQNKVLYIQIIAPDGTLIGSNETTSTGERITDYSAVAYVKFDGKSQKIVKEIPVQKLKAGMYKIKLIDGENSILEDNLKLE